MYDIFQAITPFNWRNTRPNRQNPPNFWRDISGLSMP